MARQDAPPGIGLTNAAVGRTAIVMFHDRDIPDFLTPRPTWGRGFIASWKGKRSSKDAETLGSEPSNRNRTLHGKRLQRLS